MAAYAALVSLLQIIDQIQHHPCPPISLDKSQVESLIEKVTFLQDFLEGYSYGGSTEANGLESRIADAAYAAYAAEDIIESHIVDQILAGSTSHGEKISSIDFYQGLEKVIEDMDSIKKEVMQVKEKTGVQDQPHTSSSISAGSLRSPSMVQNRTMVGVDDVLYEIMDKLIGGQPVRQIIPIVGMGGIGKTTLARNIYENQVVVQHFDILAWVTISQEYKMREILLEVLQEGRENLSQVNEYDLGYKLHKKLSGRRYLIIMDDIWNIEVWDQIKFFFPDNNNGSRILLTTRLSKLGFPDSHGLQMKLLDGDKSWILLCKIVFGKEDCPLELKKIGKKIAKNCKGLPLSIVVVGGLLGKSEQTKKYWKFVEKNLNKIVSSEDDEYCLKILYTSYNQLPVQLKPCFLYMGIFGEDNEVHVSQLIGLWVAEGFLKPISGKSLEVVAEECLKELIDRNLILVRKWGSNGKVKLCIIHDLLRDLCLKEAQKEKFFFVTRQHSPEISQGINPQRRVVIHESTRPQVIRGLQSSTLARSLICDFEVVVPGLSFRLLSCSEAHDSPSLDFRLLRVFKVVDSVLKDGTHYDILGTMFKLINSRYLALQSSHLQNFIFPSSIVLLWNLQTLRVKNSGSIHAPPEIWKMTQLRHVEFQDLYLPDPPSGHMDGRDDFVLGNLQTLLDINSFKCDEEVVKRIPNIKKLQIYYDDRGIERMSHYCLNNLGRLHKLESLTLCFLRHTRAYRRELVQNLPFPGSLKKLTLDGSRLDWEDITTMIGSLPFLEVLKLKSNSFEGPQWETVEGQFCSLRYLLIECCDDLEYWMTDSTHFPRLEHLVLRYLANFKEIPSSIGEIPTIQSIELEGCIDSACISAKKIIEEQEELGNDGLQVRVRSKESQVLASLASRNFQVKFFRS